MRYRALSASGDMTFGQGGANFLVNSPAAVAQAIATRLKLWAGEWFLDTTDGTPWSTQVLGTGTGALYDAAIQARILDTPGVLALTAYSSTWNRSARTLTISATVSTIYGSVSFGSSSASVQAPAISLGDPTDGVLVDPSGNLVSV